MQGFTEATHFDGPPPRASVPGRMSETPSGVSGIEADSGLKRMLRTLRGANVPRILETQIGMTRPWAGDFFNRDAFGLPEGGYPEVKQRLETNVFYYRSNYLAICSILFLYVL